MLIIGIIVLALVVLPIIGGWAYERQKQAQLP